MAPVVPMLKDVLAVRVIGLENAMASFVVVSVPPKETAPLPFCVNGPSTEIVAAAGLVNKPLLVIVTGALPLVVIPAF